MSKKVFYRYNQSTESYERVFPSWKTRAWIVTRQFLVGAMVGITAFLLLDSVILMPHERLLRNENRDLKAELGVMNRRLTEAIGVIEDIAQRDNNFYRVMLQADPITDAQRFAGLDREYRYNEISSLADNSLVTDLSRKMARLEREIYVESKSFDELRTLAGQQNDRLHHVPAIQPISERNLKQLASGYGRRVDPIYGTGKFHEGMDFSANIGTPVYATGDGRVKSAGWNSGYGNLIEIDHGFNYLTRYAHLSKMHVTAGQTVRRGDLIGEVGNTGKSTGPHLHYEVRYKGQPQNPVHYYFYDLTPEQYAEMIQKSDNSGYVMD